MESISQCVHFTTTGIRLIWGPHIIAVHLFQDELSVWFIENTGTWFWFCPIILPGQRLQGAILWVFATGIEFLQPLA